MGYGLSFIHFIKDSEVQEISGGQAILLSLPATVYRSRHLQLSDYYHCVECDFENFVGIYDEHFSRQYRFWRPIWTRSMKRYGNI
jgi:hypothetical protein